MTDLSDFDFDGQDEGEGDNFSLNSVDHTDGSGKSPQILQLDEWDLRKGESLLEESERLQGMEASPESVADFHALAFLTEPELVEGPVECEDRQAFVQKLLDTPEYQSLHTLTQLDELSSEIAAVHFTSQFYNLQQKRGEQKEGKEAGGAASAMKEEMQEMRAIGKALKEAKEEVQECKDAQSAFGMGPGEDGSRTDPKRIAALFKRVRNSPTLRRICELAGRYRLLAQSKQRQKTSHGYDDMVGVELGADLGRILPHELAVLDDDLLGDDAMRRLVERQLMQRQYQGVEPMGRGPVIFIVDESGSMRGEKVHTAKALALAMAWIARKQRRWCCLIAFSGDTGQRILPLPFAKWPELELAIWLDSFIGGGSNLDLPLRELPTYYDQMRCPVGKTDVIMVTDGIVSISEPVRKGFLDWKQKAQARVLSLIIGSRAGPLLDISDEVHEVVGLGISEKGVASALSI